MYRTCFCLGKRTSGASVFVLLGAIVWGSLTGPGPAWGAILPIDSTHLVLHFDAGQGTYTFADPPPNPTELTPAVAGGPVKWWDDIGPAAGNNVAQMKYSSSSPILIANAINGLPALRFDGSQNLLVLQDGPGYGPRGDALGTALDTNTLSWFIVMSTTSTETRSVMRAQVGTSADRWGSFYENGQWVSHSRTSGGTIVKSGIDAAANTFYVLSAVWDGAASNQPVTEWLNGSAGPTATGATLTGQFDRLRIGNDSAGGSSGLKGDVAEVLLYNVALSAPQRRTVEDYLWTKYFVSGPPRINDYPLGNNLRLHATGDVQDVSGTTVFDRAGTPQNGQIQGSVPIVSGVLGQAFQFNRNDANYVNFGNVFDPGPDSFTVSLWFKADSVDYPYQFLVDKGNNGSSDVGWSIWLEKKPEGTYLRVRGQQVGGTLDQRFGQSIGGIQANQWYHVVMVLDRESDVIRGYLNGSNLGWTAGGGGAQTDSLVDGSTIVASQSLYLGRAPGSGGAFAGLIDDFAIWDRALSPEEIRYLYEKGLQGFHAAMVPEPSTWVLLAVGTLALAAAHGVRRRRSGGNACVS